MEQEEHRQKKRRSYHQKKKKKKQRSDNRNQPFLVGCQKMEQQKNIVLVEILSRLPVKSLLRFMSVCRHWKSLISSHSFRKLHRQRHNSSPPLLLALHNSYEHISNDTWFPTMPFDWYLTTFDLHGNVVQQCTLPISSTFLIMMRCPSQSKLVCFTKNGTNKFFSKNGTNKFFSYNPSTRHFFHLPNPPCFSLPDFRYQNSGFGYIPSKDEYMMVHLVEKLNTKNKKNKWVCEVLTMSISYDNNYQLHYNPWKSIKVKIMLSCVTGWDVAFVCGAFYWEASDENGNNIVLSFDVETQVFSTFEFPQRVGQSWGTQLMELKDELYFVNAIDDMPHPSLYLWKLSSDVDNNKLWTLKWNMDFQSLGYIKAPPQDVFNWKLFIHRREYLQCYNANEPCNVLREMGKLKLEGDEEFDHREDGEEFVARDWFGMVIHTNLFTL